MDPRVAVAPVKQPAECDEAAEPDRDERGWARGRTHASILQLRREVEDFCARFVIAVMPEPQTLVPARVLQRGAPSSR